MVRFYKRFWLCLALLLATQAAWAQARFYNTQIAVITQPYLDGTNYNVTLFMQIIREAQGGTGALGLSSITNNTGFVPFQVLAQMSWTPSGDPPPLTLVAVQDIVNPDALFNADTLILTNYFDGTISTQALIVGQAQFMVSPQNQSVFVGDTVTFPALAYHTSGYQWQKDGTNLVDDGHFIAATNATLVITNVQLADAGNYTVVANHPYTPASAGAGLNVYKPIRLGLAVLPPTNGFNLLIANADGSGFEPERIPNLQVYSTTNLGVDFSQWNLEANTGGISNGVLQITFPDDGSSAKFWRVSEQ